MDYCCRSSTTSDARGADIACGYGDVHKECAAVRSSLKKLLNTSNECRRSDVEGRGGEGGGGWRSGGKVDTCRLEDDGYNSVPSPSSLSNWRHLRGAVKKTCDDTIWWAVYSDNDMAVLRTFVHSLVRVFCLARLGLLPWSDVVCSRNDCLRCLVPCRESAQAAACSTANLARVEAKGRPTPVTGGVKSPHDGPLVSCLS